MTVAFRSPVLPPAHLERPKERRPGQAYGLIINVGPVGSGKTLLAVRFGYRYAQRRCRGYDCGDRSCEKQWRVYTNLRSTSHWALPLEEVASSMMREDDLDHLVAIVDELPIEADARRAMSNKNLAVSRVVTQLRKRTVKMIGTAQSFDMVDSRLRALTAKVYNCWTPDGGNTVWALEYQMAQGHLPPWVRHSLRPRIVSFATRNYWSHYNSWEMVEAKLSFSAGPRHLLVLDSSGGLRQASVEQVVQAVVIRMVKEEGYRAATAEEVCQWLGRYYRHELAPVYVENLLRGLGFPVKGGKFQFVAMEAVS